MRPEEQAPWWSWAPRFPKWAIACAAVLYDAIAGMTIWVRATQGEASASDPVLLQIYNVVFTDSIVSNGLSVGMFIQLNAELLQMILTLKANYEEKKEAKAEGLAAGIAQGKAQGQAEAEAKFRTWYETHKDQLPADFPAPPFSENGSRNGAGPC